MNFTTEQQLWEHYSDNTIKHNNINDLINDWLNVVQFTDNDGNVLTEQELKNHWEEWYLMTSACKNTQRIT